MAVTTISSTAFSPFNLIALFKSGFIFVLIQQSIWLITIHVIRMTFIYFICGLMVHAQTAIPVSLSYASTRLQMFALKMKNAFQLRNSVSLYMAVDERTNEKKWKRCSLIGNSHILNGIKAIKLTVSSF